MDMGASQMSLQGQLLITFKLTWILSKEALGTAEVLPYEGRVSLKVIHKNLIKSLRPVHTIHYS